MDGYVDAWETYDEAQITDLFGEDVAYYERPFLPAARGRDAVLEVWRDHQDPPGTWKADYAAQMVDGNRGFATGTSSYLGADGSVEERYHNVFLLTFDDDGRCTEYREWYVPEPKGA